MKIPFRACDIPGALASGFLILAACEAGYDGSWLIDHDWTPDRISRYGAIACGIGVVVAEISRRVIEDRLMAAWLGRPEEFLLAGVTASPRDWRWTLFPGYYAPLAEESRDRIVRAQGRDVPDGVGRGGAGDATFEICPDPAKMHTLSFQLYTTCRTLCLAFLIVSAILASGIVWHSAVFGWGQAEWRKFGYCLLSLFESAGMLYRYLKYFRQNAIEVIVRKTGTPHWSDTQDGETKTQRRRN